MAKEKASSALDAAAFARLVAARKGVRAAGAAISQRSNRSVEYWRFEAMEQEARDYLAAVHAWKAAEDAAKEQA